VCRHVARKRHDDIQARLGEVENNMSNAVRQYSQSIERFVGFLGTNIVSNVAFIVRQVGTDVRDLVETSVSRVLGAVFAVSTDVGIIKAIVLRLDRGLDTGEYFMLEDATGRTIRIDMRTIISWETFDFIIIDRFKGKPGESRIRRKRYALHERASHQPIDRSRNFVDAFVPFRTVNMSLICRVRVPDAPTPADGDSGLSVCPWCKTVSPGTLGAHVQCPNCNGSFVRVVIEAGQLDDATFAPTAPTSEGGLRRRRMKGNGNDGVDGDTGDETCGECRQTIASPRKGADGLDSGSELESDEENFTGFAHLILETTRSRCLEIEPRPLGAVGAESNMVTEADDAPGRDLVTMSNSIAEVQEEDIWGALGTSWKKKKKKKKAAENTEVGVADPAPESSKLQGEGGNMDVSQPSTTDVQTEDPWGWGTTKTGKKKKKKSSSDTNAAIETSKLRVENEPEPKGPALAQADAPETIASDSSAQPEVAGTQVPLQNDRQTTCPYGATDINSDATATFPPRPHLSPRAYFSPRYTTDGTYSTANTRPQSFSPKHRSRQQLLDDGDFQVETVEFDGQTYILLPRTQDKPSSSACYYDSSPYYNKGVQSLYGPAPTGSEESFISADPLYYYPHSTPVPKPPPKLRRASVLVTQKHGTTKSPSGTSQASTSNSTKGEILVGTSPQNDKKTAFEASKRADADKAKEAAAKRHRVPRGYSLKNWDPTEEPIYLLGSVFDANSLGKWIYDWTVYHHGTGTPISAQAGDLWLLLIKMAGKIKRAETALPKIRSKDNQEMVEGFINAGERVMDKFKKLLKACEGPMLKRAGKQKEACLGKRAGVEFVETLFGKGRELEKTEKWMTGGRLWNLRFDANCEDILRKPSM